MIIPIWNTCYGYREICALFICGMTVYCFRVWKADFMKAAKYLDIRVLHLFWYPVSKKFYIRFGFGAESISNGISGIGLGKTRTLIDFDAYYVCRITIKYAKHCTSYSTYPRSIKTATVYLFNCWLVSLIFDTQCKLFHFYYFQIYNEVSSLHNQEYFIYAFLFLLILFFISV